MEPPPPGRRRELWLQQLAGWVVFRDVRDYARKAISLDLDPVARGAALAAIDDAVYGLMMVFDGVAGGVGSDEWSAELSTSIRLRHGPEVTDEITLNQGDGMCMGYHRWIEDDFGDLGNVDTN